MLNPIDRSSIKSELFSETVIQQEARDSHPFRPEIKDRKRPKIRPKLQTMREDIQQHHFLF